MRFWYYGLGGEVGDEGLCLVFGFWKPFCCVVVFIASGRWEKGRGLRTRSLILGETPQVCVRHHSRLQAANDALGGLGGLSFFHACIRKGLLVGIYVLFSPGLSQLNT
jgi:hypothetical protein